MKKSSKYVIVGITAVAVAFSVGFYVSPSFLVQSDSNYVQTLGIGAYVVVEAYHEDGTLFQKWEGHNDLTNIAQNTLVSCISGASAAPSFWGGCVLDVNTLQVEEVPQGGGTHSLTNVVTTLTLIPPGCDVTTTTYSKMCTGWKLEGVRDYNTLVCTPSVDCIDVNQVVGSGAPSSAFYDFAVFNNVNVSPVISISPNDRLVIAMTFDVPA